MGEFIIECTLCGSSFGFEKDYDSHPCLDIDVKVPFKIKLEQGEDEEEKELESETQHMLNQASSSRNQNGDVCMTAIKEEPSESLDVEDEDPLDLRDNEKEEVVDEAEPMLEDALEDDNLSIEEEVEELERMDPTTKVENVTDAVSIRNECGICGKRFYRKEDFLTHTTNSHKIPRPFQCKVCKKRFTQKHYVTLHMRVHTGERPYKCHLCPNSYSHKTSYTIHMRIHTGDRPYMCGVCGKKCYDKSGLTSHMRSHTKETPYECEVCGRRFTHSKSLLVHRRNHTGEKPYKCEYCGKCFRHWHKHKIHIRLHTGERPYRCKICGKGFPRNDEVKRHMRSHQGIKSFKCSICGVYCATQASITGHIDLHHADLRTIDPNAPEKTVVKNSHSGILGTKAPQPRTIYKPVASVATQSKCVGSSAHQKTSVFGKNNTSNFSVKKDVKKVENKQESKTQSKEGEKTKVLSYKEFIELQEKLLICKGLTVKNPQGHSVPSKSNVDGNSDNKNGTQSNVSNATVKHQNTRTPCSVSGQVLDTNIRGKQIMVLSTQSGQKGEGTRFVVPQSLRGGKQVAATASTSVPAGQRIVIRQPSVFMPQAQVGGNQQIVFLSKPGSQQNSVMLSQPLLLVSGGNSQCMVLVPSASTAGSNTGTLQTLLLPASAVSTQINNGTIASENKVVTKKEPGEVASTNNIAPKITIKQEPGVQLPGAVIIKQEPVDDDSSTTNSVSNIVIKQEPQD
ncbi:uncharacterized protein [Cherax quadricarinatus]